MINCARPQISVENLIKVQQITGRSSHDFDSSLKIILKNYLKFEKFYKKNHGDSQK